MKLIYKGNKPSETGISGVSMLFLLIGIGALIFFFSIADADSIKEHIWGLIFIFLMLGSILYSFFQKKSDSITANILIKEKELWLMQTGNLAFETLHLDVYFYEGKFRRYHLWDEEGKLAVYAAFEDELPAVLEKLPIEKNEFIETGSTLNESRVKVTCENNRQLIYHLDTGAYEIKQADYVITCTPECFMTDPRFKAEKVADHS